MIETKVEVKEHEELEGAVAWELKVPDPTPAEAKVILGEVGGIQGDEIVVDEIIEEEKK